MANIIANAQAGGAIAVKFYGNKGQEDKEIVIGDKNDGIGKLEENLICVLAENGSTYKNKYAKQLKKAIER